MERSRLGPLRIVAMGGGSGLATLLKGLKELRPAEITAVVTVTDDGGSSGRLRRDFAVLPPGDIRNCLVAMAEDETLLAKLFRYRFGGGRGLKGHSLGNLFLTALADITGDFQQAVQVSSEVLAIHGRILPSTTSDVRLRAKLENGASVSGETQIGRSRSRIRAVRLEPAHCQPLPETLDAIAAADLITLGPGSLYTSVIPHLLVEGIADALAASGAIKAYVCNLMCQPGETIGYTASDHVGAILEHGCAGGRRGALLDYVVVNSQKVPARLARRYARWRSRPVEVDLEALEAQRVQLLADSLLAKGPVVRHEPGRLARVLAALARQGNLERAIL